ncbi:TrkA C-terminal domain-containing protein [Haloflavibacter putidus]|uniref:Potassium transporter TrkA n=1 Tax=Haloflavibacter putidus TaxID=2576776 RepID=A0A507ZN77_9FLAO|nr:TrkA C-terminal domain-containing protein [Haloflavibacter putidus]TQD37694.1 potassium transporter TrkA [Haloflavibacter putidus]
MIAAISLFLIVSLSLLLTKIATLALVHTGLSTQSASFQARSAYTGTGYTTSEAEKVVNHPVRRRIISMLMIIGNAGIVTAMSSLILTFLIPDKTSSLLYSIGVIVFGIVFLWWAVRSKWVDRYLSKIINKALDKYTSLDVKDYAAILHLEGGYQVTEWRVTEDSYLREKTLNQLQLIRKGIIVLGIQKATSEYIGSPYGKSMIEEGDTLTLYGKKDSFQLLRKE